MPSRSELSSTDPIPSFGVLSESKRYKSKGYGALIAVFISASFIYLWPILAQEYWALCLDFIARHNINMSHFYIIHVVVLNWSVLLSVHLLFALIYHLEWDCFERYKILEEPWPWQSMKPEEWRAYLKKTIKVNLINNMVMGPLGFAVYLLVPVDKAMDVSPDGIPSRYQFALQLYFCMIFEDLGFHIFHRILHRPSIYPYIHKIHHEYKVSVAIASQYMHPIEFLILITPAGIGPAILG